MATTVSNKSPYDNDDENDIESDEDEWLERTQHIANRCACISNSGHYEKPFEFHTEFVEYGDGGDANLEYPIWVRDNVLQFVSNDNNDVREELLEVFYKINNQRKDFHKYPSPVEDIIDPDLLVCKPIQPLPPPPSPSMEDESILEEETFDQIELYYDSCNRWNYNPSSLRGSYQWIPSEFRICHGENDDCQVHIETPITHLPMTEEYRSTYRNLEKIFSKLVPMFNKILFFDKSNGDTRLQVIVKVQSYHIQPGIKYSGRWHTEGCTENIKAVGVYYLHIDDQLEGGALKFRPSVAPSKYYAKRSDIEINRYLMPKTDLAIVFDNGLPHRFCSIRNSTTIARRRTFINFFIVSPSHPIHPISITNLPLVSYEQCLILLKNIENEYGQQILPDIVIEKILSFLKKSMWQTDIDAKEFRSRVRHELVNEKSGWAGVQYGNFGNIVFIKSANDWNIRKKQICYKDLQRNLEHTESE